MDALTGGRLTFFDVSRLYYAAYYLNGFRQLARRGGPELRITGKVPEPLRSVLADTDWQHLLFAVHVFVLEAGGRTVTFCIDTHDSNTVDANARSGGFHLPLLDYADAYFKVNYNPTVIAELPELRPYARRIHPVAQFLPVRPDAVLPWLNRVVFPPGRAGLQPGLGHDRPYAGYWADLRRRLLDIKNFRTLRQLYRTRGRERDIDVFFITGYHRNPRHQATMERRFQLIRRLRSLGSLNVITGFANYQGLPSRYADVAHPRLSQADYIDLISRAKVWIYVRGTDGCISSKFALASLSGTAMVGEPLANNPALVERYPHLREQLVSTDPVAIVDRAVSLVAAPGLCGELAAANREMFDSTLAPLPAVREVLTALL